MTVRCPQCKEIVELITDVSGRFIYVQRNQKILITDKGEAVKAWIPHLCKKRG